MTGYLLNSSNLHCVDYEPWHATLVIEFHGGRVYAFYHVPEAMFRGLLEASSHGRFFHQNIKDRYAYRQIG